MRRLASLHRPVITGAVSTDSVFHNPIDDVFPARRSLLIAAAIQPDCFEMVLTRMLVSYQK